MALSWYRALNEMSENVTAFRSPARTALKTSTANLHFTNEGIKSNTQNSNHSSEGKTNLSHWIRVSRCVCYPSARSKEVVGPPYTWNRKCLRAKRNIISENTGDKMIDTDTSWLFLNLKDRFLWESRQKSKSFSK